MDKTEQRELLGPGDFARHLGISRTTFWNWRKAGIIPPANIHHGNVRRWSLASLDTLTQGKDFMNPLDQRRVDALTNIKRMLGLENTSLTQAQQWTLLDLFDSVPYGHRMDGSLLAAHLEPALLCITAFSRDETHKTVKSSPRLQEILKTITQKVNTLMV